MCITVCLFFSFSLFFVLPPIRVFHEKHTRTEFLADIPLGVDNIGTGIGRERVPPSTLGLPAAAASRLLERPVRKTNRIPMCESQSVKRRREKRQISLQRSIYKTPSSSFFFPFDYSNGKSKRRKKKVEMVCLQGRTRELHFVIYFVVVKTFYLVNRVSRSKMYI